MQMRAKCARFSSVSETQMQCSMLLQFPYIVAFGVVVLAVVVVVAVVAVAVA